jgi:hypothetical protein
MVAVLARRGTDLLEECTCISGVRVVIKQTRGNVMAACGFADLEDLVTAKDAEDLVWCRRRRHCEMKPCLYSNLFRSSEMQSGAITVGVHAN